VLAIPNGAKAGQGGKRRYAGTWIAPEAIPGCLITAYLRKIAAERHRRHKRRPVLPWRRLEGRRSGGYSLRLICVR
jgi:hypothetical protein